METATKIPASVLLISSDIFKWLWLIPVWALWHSSAPPSLIGLSIILCDMEKHEADRGITF